MRRPPWFPHVSLVLLRRLAFASLLANVGIVVTGGAVRLTGSGLGCPTWPTCTDESWLPTPEMGVHGVIEYANRTLTGVLGVIALAGLLAALALRPRRRSLVWLAAGVLAGIGAQGLIGAVTVLTRLNPWTVGAHFLVSMALIAVAYTFWRWAGGSGPPVPVVPAPLRALARVMVGTAAVLLAVGTVVTGSGPHAGDAEVPRNGLDQEILTQAHADLAFLLLGLSVAAWFAARAVGASAAARAAVRVVVVILAQGAVGVTQFYTGLPEPLVGLHLFGACLLWLAVLDLRYRTRHPAPVQAAEPPERAWAEKNSHMVSLMPTS